MNKRSPSRVEVEFQVNPAEIHYIQHGRWRSQSCEDWLNDCKGMDAALMVKVAPGTAPGRIARQLRALADKLDRPDGGATRSSREDAWIYAAIERDAQLEVEYRAFSELDFARMTPSAKVSVEDRMLGIAMERTVLRDSVKQAEAVRVFTKR